MKYYENMNQYETSHLKHSSNISFVKRLIAEIKFNGHRVSPKCLIEGINAFAGPLRPLMLSVCDGLNCFFEGKKLLQQLSPHYLIMPLTLLQLSVQLILRFPLLWMELECSLNLVLRTTSSSHIVQVLQNTISKVEISCKTGLKQDQHSMSWQTQLLRNF